MIGSRGSATRQMRPRLSAPMRSHQTCTTSVICCRRSHCSSWIARRQGVVVYICTVGPLLLACSRRGAQPIPRQYRNTVGNSFWHEIPAPLQMGTISMGCISSKRRPVLARHHPSDIASTRTAVLQSCSLASLVAAGVVVRFVSALMLQPT